MQRLSRGISFDGSRQHTADVWRTYTDIGCQAYVRQDYKTAFRFFHVAFKLAVSKPGQQGTIAISRYNLSLIYRIQGRYAKAVRFLEETVRQMETCPEAAQVHLPKILDALADVYLQVDESRKALACYERAQEIDRNRFGGSHAQLSRRLKKIAAVHLKDNRHDLACRYYIQASRLAVETAGAYNCRH